jgi:hypothetical protein
MCVPAGVAATFRVTRDIMHRSRGTCAVMQVPDEAYSRSSAQKPDDLAHEDFGRRVHGGMLLTFQSNDACI